MFAVEKQTFEFHNTFYRRMQIEKIVSLFKRQLSIPLIGKMVLTALPSGSKLSVKISKDSNKGYLEIFSASGNLALWNSFEKKLFLMGAWFQGLRNKHLIICYYSVARHDLGADILRFTAVMHCSNRMCN